MEPYAEFDRSSFPTVVVKFTGVKSTDENFKSYLEEMKGLYDEEKTLALVFDSRSASIPQIRHQRMQAHWLKENKSLLETYCRGTAYVISSIPIRTVLRMIFAITPQPVPYRIVGDMDSAKNWVEERLQD